MKSEFKALIILPFFILFFYGCKKEAGEGGGATIEGKLFGKNFHSPEVPYTDDDTEADKKIFITYGDQTMADDDVNTGYDGSFKFSFLRKGTYNIYFYSLDPESNSNDYDIPFVKTVEITKNNQKVILDDLIIYEEADNNGSSSIRGRVFVRDYNSALTIVLDSFYVADEEVFAVFGKDSISGVSKRIRTSHDGSYEFSNLRKGSYKIYALSKSATTTANVAIMQEVTITQNREVVQIPDINIAK